MRQPIACVQMTDAKDQKLSPAAGGAAAPAGSAGAAAAGTTTTFVPDGWFRVTLKQRFSNSDALITGFVPTFVRGNKDVKTAPDLPFPLPSQVGISNAKCIGGGQIGTVLFSKPDLDSQISFYNYTHDLPRTSQLAAMRAMMNDLGPMRVFDSGKTTRVLNLRGCSIVVYRHDNIIYGDPLFEQSPTVNRMYMYLRGDNTFSTQVLEPTDEIFITADFVEQVSAKDLQHGAALWHHRVMWMKA